MITELPVRGTRTFYARAGDWFAWACMALVAVLSYIGIREAATPDKKRPAQRPGRLMTTVPRDRYSTVPTKATKAMM